MPLPGGLSVLIPSNFIAARLWCEPLLLICIFCCLLLFSPFHPLPLLNRVLQAPKTPPQRCYYLTAGSAGKLMQTHAFQEPWRKDRVSCPSSQHRCGETTEINVVFDSKQQHGNVSCRPVPDNKVGTITH